MDERLDRLQAWYHAQCDGDWEHDFGVSIGTLDNPGWFVTIDLRGTGLEDVAFAPVQELDHAMRWISCEVRESKWLGHGGPRMLPRVLDEFLRWAGEHQAPHEGA